MTTTYEISNRRVDVLYDVSQDSRTVVVRRDHASDAASVYNPERFGDTLGDGLSRRIDRTRSLTRHDGVWSQLKRSAMRHGPGHEMNSEPAIAYVPRVPHACRRQLPLPHYSYLPHDRFAERHATVFASPLSRGNATARSQVRAHHLPSHEEIHMSFTTLRINGKTRVCEDCGTKFNGTSKTDCPKCGYSRSFTYSTFQNWRESAAKFNGTRERLQRVFNEYATLTPIQAREQGAIASDAERKEIADALDIAIETKESCERKTDAWYDADTMIMKLAAAVYAERSIDPVAMLDAAGTEDEA